VEYGAIIKRAWNITWRYRALWLLGLFAGISGCQGGGGNGGGGGGNSGYDFSAGDPFGANAEAWLARALPLIIAGSVLLFAVLIIWSIFGVAARGGLVFAVNELEEGRERSLGESWREGFKHFWSVVGLGILFNLPQLLVGLVVVFAVILPFVGALVGGREPGPEVVAPICGSLVVGVPLLIVLSVVLGMLYLVGLRYIVLGGQGTMDAARNAWRFLRVRFKDTFLMYLINAGLNIAASLVVAIPAAIIGIAIAIPLATGFVQRDWQMVGVPLAFGVLVLVLLSWLYLAIWGTYTSSLWTLFFRRVMGVGALVATPATPGYPQYPAASGGPYPPTGQASEQPYPPYTPTPQPEPPAPPQPPAPPEA